MRFVKIRVLDGGVGCVKGGRLDKSRVRDVRDPLEELVQDGEGGVDLVRSRSISVDIASCDLLVAIFGMKGLQRCS